MHGEYKTPGGKLVVADFEVCDGCLDCVRISGDFFLYPDDALFAIVAALAGAPIDADFAARVVAALPPGTEMLGVSPEAIAEAIRRGLASC
ncbi:MAG: hypothetical protein U0746_04955 [Gemmataceae bacterium]